MRRVFSYFLNFPAAENILCEDMVKTAVFAFHYLNLSVSVKFEKL